ncbi:MAG: DUF721 domain-containing protein [Lentisphaeria bacterium]|nr:DUF721 domain-containing protein [Lentisphaeria bacterium]
MVPAHNNDSSPDAPSDEAEWLARRDNCERRHRGRRPSGRERRREEALGDWYGKERATEEFALLRGPLKQVSELVDAVLDDVGAQPNILVEKLGNCWADVVGRDASRNCHPTVMRDGVLFVEVKSAPWLYMLERQQKTAVLERVNTFSRGEIKDVRFVAAGRYNRNGGFDDG